MSYMQKSRTLASDLGDSPGKYAGQTSGIYIPSATWTYLEKNYKYEYSRGKSVATSSATQPIGLGSETFQSTTKPRPLFNSCYHEKRMGFNYPYLLCTLVAPSTYGAWQPYMRMATTGSFGMIPAHLGASWADVDGCQRRAWWSMQPRYESEISLLNFIYEMKDFKHLFKRAVHWRDTIKKVRDFRRKIVTHIRGGKSPLKTETTLYGLSNIPASGWLTYQFAIKPLINDVVELLRIFHDTVQGAQDEFHARGLERQITHYTETLGNTLTGTWGVGSSAWLYTGARQYASFTATLEYTYSYIRRVGYEMYAKYLGLNVTPEVIWNAVLLSFVFDYFCRIGDALHMAALDPNVTLNILQYSESIRQVAHYGRACDPESQVVKIFYAPSANGGKSVGFSDKNYVALTGYQDQIYERRVGRPNKGAVTPRFKLPGKTQQWNMVALVRSFMK